MEYHRSELCSSNCYVDLYRWGVANSSLLEDYIVCLDWPQYTIYYTVPQVKTLNTVQRSHFPWYTSD